MLGPSSMDSMTLVMRPLIDEETLLLAEAVLGNVNWCGPRFTPANVSEWPEFARYTVLVSNRGDFGLVAQMTGEVDGAEEEDGEAVGVVWAQFFTDDQPGYGFIDEATPELSVWVREGCRGRGIGRALLRAMKDEALRRGIPRLSLSVEEGNFARILYADEGFRAVPGREKDGVMLWEVPAGR